MANTYSLDLETSSSQYASISDGLQTGLDITGDMTIELWVKLESQPATDETMYFVSKYKGTVNQRSFYVGYQDESGTKKLALDLSSDGTSGNDSRAKISYTLTNGVYTHIAFIYTAASPLLEIAINGSSIGSSAGDLKTSIFNSTSTFMVGSLEDDSTHNLDGLIDELRIWNVARSIAQVNANYGIELNGSESGLQAYWRFNNNYEDQTSNNNDLTASGSPVFSTDVPFVTDASSGSGFIFTTF